MEKEELIEKLYQLGVSDNQIHKLFKDYTLEKILDYYNIIIYKRDILKEKSIRNWVAFFMKNIKDNIDISYMKRQMEQYYHRKQSHEEQKKIEEQEAIDKKSQHQQYLIDYGRMNEVISQLSESEKMNMNFKINIYIQKEYGDIKFGVNMLRNFEIIKIFQKYNWDINTIKERLK